jgi:hypothetical protein
VETFCRRADWAGGEEKAILLTRADRLSIMYLGFDVSVSQSITAHTGAFASRRQRPAGLIISHAWRWGE